MSFVTYVGWKKWCLFNLFYIQTYMTINTERNTHMHLETLIEMQQFNLSSNEDWFVGIIILIFPTESVYVNYKSEVIEVRLVCVFFLVSWAMLLWRRFFVTKSCTLRLVFRLCLFISKSQYLMFNRLITKKWKALQVRVQILPLGSHIYSVRVVIDDKFV